MIKRTGNACESKQPYGIVPRITSLNCHMKIKIVIHGCFPSLQSLDERQFANAIEQRLIDMRSPVTGLQIDVFGKVSSTDIRHEQQLVVAELAIDDAFLTKNALTVALATPVLVARVSKLRHPATGAMHPVSAELLV